MRRLLSQSFTALQGVWVKVINACIYCSQGERLTFSVRQVCALLVCPSCPPNCLYWFSHDILRKLDIYCHAVQSVLTAVQYVGWQNVGVFRLLNGGGFLCFYRAKKISGKYQPGSEMDSRGFVSCTFDLTLQRPSFQPGRLSDPMIGICVLFVWLQIKWNKSTCS